MGKKRSTGKSKPVPVKSNVWEDARQLVFAAAYRIPAPEAEREWPADPALLPVTPAAQPDGNTQVTDLPLASVASCLWYLKTKYFKREWTQMDNQDDDPRVRRALGRLNKGIDALRQAGIDVQDPTNKRYAAGSENLMRPIQTQPTPGLTFEKVSETVVPIVFRNDRLIQRGEVFVAVPQDVPGPARPQPTT